MATDDRRGTIHEHEIDVDRGRRGGRTAVRPGKRGGPGAVDGQWRMAVLWRQSLARPLLPPRPDNRRELQRAGGRLAVQHRQLGPAARDELPVDAVDGQRDPLRHRGVAAGGGRARSGDRRAVVDAPHRRRRTRRERAAPFVRPRTRLLGRRGGRGRALRDPRLPARGPQRAHRVRGGGLRRQRRRGPEAEHRPGPGADLRDRPALGADRRRRHRPDRGRPPARRRSAVTDQRQGLRAGIRRPHRRRASGSSTRFPAATSSATTPGRTTRGATPATPARGASGPWTPS